MPRHPAPADSRPRFSGGLLQNKNDKFDPRDPLLPHERSIWDDTKATILASGEPKPDPELVDALVKNARAMAARLYLDRFDKKNPADAGRHEEYENALAERAELQDRRRHAVIRQREAAEHLATLPDPGRKPKIKFSYLLAAILALAASVGPTIHDLLLDLRNSPLVWFLSYLIGIVVGFVVAIPIASTVSTDPEHPSKGFWALIPGVVVAVGILLLRLAGVARGPFCLMLNPPFNSKLPSL